MVMTSYVLFSYPYQFNPEIFMSFPELICSNQHKVSLSNCHFVVK